MANQKRAIEHRPHRRKLTIVAQDPGVRIGRQIVTTEVEVPAEELGSGPTGYRVKVVDYDASTNTLYEAPSYPVVNGDYVDPFKKALSNEALLQDPRFHAQNVYAIAMRTLARFEYALGRRTAWGCEGHQIHIAPHAFAEANAFYSRADRGVYFGYFKGASGNTVYTCLSHDVVAHETTHALLDGLRERYTEPSSPDQAAFHEGFSDIVALLSVFSLPDVVSTLLDPSRRKSGPTANLVQEKFLTKESLKTSILLGLADEMGSELSRIRGQALRRSVTLKTGHDYMSDPQYLEPHARGELVVAAMMNAFLDIWLARLAKIGRISGRRKDRSLVVEEGARVAEHLLTMSIRAIDYCPPTDICFPDYLSALLTVDLEVVPDDSKYGYRDSLLKNFRAYGILPAPTGNADGTWKRFDKDLAYGRTHFESMLSNKEEVFRFIWENRGPLGVDDRGYVEVASVLPSTRIGPDGFILRETVAQYIQILTVTAGELTAVTGVKPPDGMPEWRRLRLYGGGSLVFDEYGQLKYQISNRLDNVVRQEERLQYLFDMGYFDTPVDQKSHFAALHMQRAMTRGGAV